MQVQEAYAGRTWPAPGVLQSTSLRRSQLFCLCRALLEQRARLLSAQLRSRAIAVSCLRRCVHGLSAGRRRELLGSSVA